MVSFVTYLRGLTDEHLYAFVANSLARARPGQLGLPPTPPADLARMSSPEAVQPARQ